MFNLIVKLMNLIAVRDHIRVELHIIYIRIAPVHVSLSVVIDEHARVNVIPMLFLPYERLAERIRERSIRRV